MNTMNETLASWRRELSDELTERILPFWGALLDWRSGGISFPGRVDGYGRPHHDAGVGAVLAARMLWFFSAAYRTTRREEALTAARRMRRYVGTYLIDRRHGGVFWELAPDARPRDCRKQSYAIGFAIYGLAEYARATGDTSASDEATALFETLESHAFDAGAGGYVEAFARDWQPLDDMRLSLRDMNAVFSMNTHLHILESYAELLRVAESERIRQRVVGLLEIFAERIYDRRTGHLNLFFDAAWRPQSDTVSYGHDIEASWLIDDAARAAGCSGPETNRLVGALAAAAAEGLQPDGSMAYEYEPADGRTDADRHWWVQAESAVGWLNMYERTGDACFFERSRRAWRYISEHLLDRTAGEWFWSVRADGSVNRIDDKAGFWKCPYHNGRMCLELMRRIDRITSSKP